MSNPTSFARRLPKVAKRTAGRTRAPQVPANIRVFRVDLSQEERARIRHGLGVKLGKYETSIERVTVRVLDVNGPRGGVDKVCRIKVVLSGLPSVVFEAQALAGGCDPRRTLWHGAGRTPQRTAPTHEAYQVRNPEPISPQRMTHPEGVCLCLSNGT